MRDASSERLGLKERERYSSSRSDNPTIELGREETKEIVSCIYAGVDLRCPDDPTGSEVLEQLARRALLALAIGRLHARLHDRRPDVQIHREPRQHQNEHRLEEGALLCRLQTLSAPE